jgi:DNA-binding transcriptional LysR family regulator
VSAEPGQCQVDLAIVQLGIFQRRPGDLLNVEADTRISLRDAFDHQTPPDVLAGILVGKAFEARGCKAPTAQIATSSIHLRNNLASRGDYIAVLPRSVLRLGAKQYGLKELAIRLDFGPSPVAIITLRGRTLTPATRATIDCAREVAARML